VAEHRVSEGSVVQAGQVLFVIATDRNGIEGPTAALVAACLARIFRALLLKNEDGIAL
jgi:hypothetical protein